MKAGQPLVVIDSPDLGTAYSDYDRAKVLLALALKTRDPRARAGRKSAARRRKDLQQAETDYVTAEVEYHTRHGAFEADRRQRSRRSRQIRDRHGGLADGRQRDRSQVAPGEYWNDPTAAMMTVADLNTIWVTASVPEKDLSLVSKGQAVDVVLAAYPGEVFKGQVLFVSDVLDPRHAAHQSPHRLRKSGHAAAAGNVRQCQLSTRRLQSVPVVPTSALVLKDDLNQVFVETAPWTFEARTVDIGFQQGDQAVLKSGVKVGDRVVVRGGVLLGD